MQSTPIVTCDAAGIGSVHLMSDLPTLPRRTPPNDSSATITSISTGHRGRIPYCLVKVHIPPAINIWVGLPTGGNWNGRLQSEGGGGYAGCVGIPTGSIAAGYVGVQTDTGHTGGGGTFGCLNDCAGATASPVDDKQLQIDFAYRSEHLMAVIGKQLAQAFYGRQPSSRTGTVARPAGARACAWRRSFRTTTTASWPARRRSIGTASRPIRYGRRWRCVSIPADRSRPPRKSWRSTQRLPRVS